MQSRKEALDYGLAFPDTYVETPFRDTNWLNAARRLFYGYMRKTDTLI